MLLVHALLPLLGVLCIAETAHITKRLKLSQPHSYIASINSHLLIISKNDTHLHVNSTDGSVKSCDIEIDFEKHILRNNVQVTTVGRKIVVSGVHADHDLGLTIKLTYTILIVDPWQCSYKIVMDSDDETPRTSFNTNDYSPRLVASNHSFDVFYPSLTTCAPCGYSVDGSRINLQHQLVAEDVGRNTYFLMERFDKPDLEVGYLYVHNYDNQTAVMKLLKGNFTTAEQKYLDHLVKVASVGFGANSSINICYVTTPTWGRSVSDRVHCERFDAHLQSQFSVDIPLSLKGKVDDVSLNVDPSGDLFVSVARSVSDYGQDFKVFRLDSTGAVVDSFGFGRVVENNRIGKTKLRGFLVNDLYCLEISYIHWYYYSMADGSIECITI